jgi:hypothetical protein
MRGRRLLEPYVLSARSVSRATMKRRVAWHPTVNCLAAWTLRKPAHILEFAEIIRSRQSDSGHQFPSRSGTLYNDAKFPRGLDDSLLGRDRLLGTRNKLNSDLINRAPRNSRPPMKLI